MDFSSPEVGGLVLKEGKVLLILNSKFVSETRKSSAEASETGAISRERKSKQVKLRHELEGDEAKDRLEVTSGTFFPTQAPDLIFSELKCKTIHVFINQQWNLCDIQKK